MGGVNREINVTLDPSPHERVWALRRLMVNSALQRSYRNYGGGRAAVGGSETTTRVIGETLTVEPSCADLTIPLRGGTSYVKLSDVADVGDGSARIRAVCAPQRPSGRRLQRRQGRCASEVDVETRRAANRLRGCRSSAILG